MSASPCIVVIERDQRPLRPDEPEKWNATLGDETVVHRSADVSHDACRVLLARGITGQVTFVHRKTGTAGLSMDIEKGAKRTVTETRAHGPRFEPYRPFPSAVSSPESEDAHDYREAAE